LHRGGQLTCAAVLRCWGLEEGCRIIARYISIFHHKQFKQRCCTPCVPSYSKIYKCRQTMSLSPYSSILPHHVFLQLSLHGTSCPLQLHRPHHCHSSCTRQYQRKCCRKRSSTAEMPSSRVREGST